MLEQTYSKWLERDVMAMQYALLVALEKKGYFAVHRRAGSERRIHAKDWNI